MLFFSLFVLSNSFLPLLVLNDPITLPFSVQKSFFLFLTTTLTGFLRSLLYVSLFFSIKSKTYSFSLSLVFYLSLCLSALFSKNCSLSSMSSPTTLPCLCFFCSHLILSVPPLLLNNNPPCSFIYIYIRVFVSASASASFVLYA